jgi:hypothetical protein
MKRKARKTAPKLLVEVTKNKPMFPAGYTVWMEERGEYAIRVAEFTPGQGGMKHAKAEAERLAGQLRALLQLWGLI